MLISDWSSDVCSSELGIVPILADAAVELQTLNDFRHIIGYRAEYRLAGLCTITQDHAGSRRRRKARQCQRRTPIGLALDVKRAGDRLKPVVEEAALHLALFVILTKQLPIDRGDHDRKSTRLNSSH